MKVSIRIAVYNAVAGVATLLNRVPSQPLPGMAKETILVESNSKDGSRELVAAFAARHAANQSQRRAFGRDLSQVQAFELGRGPDPRDANGALPGMFGAGRAAFRHRTLPCASP